MTVDAYETGDTVALEDETGPGPQSHPTAARWTLLASRAGPRRRIRRVEPPPSVRNLASSGAVPRGADVEPPSVLRAPLPKRPPPWRWGDRGRVDVEHDDD